MGQGLDAGKVDRVILRTPAGTLTPLIHHRPGTGLQSKFSIEYAVAAALLDRHQGFACFTDEAVRRPAALRLMDLVEVRPTDGELARKVAGCLTGTSLDPASIDWPAAAGVLRRHL